jgi:F-type H+-transporting ATPase subunit epsilon
MASFHLLVVAPERVVLDDQVTLLTLRSAGGDIGFLAGHVPFVGALRPSLAHVEHEGGGTSRLALHGGFVEVAPDGTVTVLADVVERAEEIDVARAERAAERARSALASAGADGDAEAWAALARAEVRLEAALALGSR